MTFKQVSNEGKYVRVRSFKPLDEDDTSMLPKELPQPRETLRALKTQLRVQRMQDFPSGRNQESAYAYKCPV